METPDQYRWTNSIGSDPADAHTDAWLTGMFHATRTGRRTIRALVRELAGFPDLTVDYTEGHGWRHRNIRVRATGPAFAINAAYRLFRDRLEG